jgi:hypothetical protein
MNDIKNFKVCAKVEGFAHKIILRKLFKQYTCKYFYNDKDGTIYYKNVVRNDNDTISVAFNCFATFAEISVLCLTDNGYERHTSINDNTTYRDIDNFINDFINDLKKWGVI